MNVKNYVFDLGNVILKGFPSDILDELNLSKEDNEIIKNTFFSNWVNIDLGNITLEQHYDSFNLNLPLEFKDKLINYYEHRSCNEEIIKFMYKLKEEGYNIYILSNNNKETVKFLKTSSWSNIISGWVVSCDYNIVKPDLKIYEILFDKYNLNPKECYFIDDKEANVLAGISLGMNGHVLDYENFEISKLLEDLNRN